MNITNDEKLRAGDIAGLFGLAPKTVHNHYITKKDFPRPIDTPQGRRWLKDEVVTWWNNKHVRSQ